MLYVEELGYVHLPLLQDAGCPTNLHVIVMVQSFHELNRHRCTLLASSAHLDDLALAGEEHQNVTRCFIQMDLHCCVNGRLVVVIVMVLQ